MLSASPDPPGHGDAPGGELPAEHRLRLRLLNAMPPGTAGPHPVPLRIENRQFLGNYLGPPYPQIHSKFSFLGNFVEKAKKIIKFREIPTKFHQNRFEK